MRAKIAPTLCRVLDYRDVDPECDPEMTREARAELRALLTVARAAKGLTAYLGSDSPGVSRGELSKPERAVVGALARLDRASRASGRGR